MQFRPNPHRPTYPGGMSSQIFEWPNPESRTKSHTHADCNPRSVFEIRRKKTKNPYPDMQSGQTRADQHTKNMSGNEVMRALT